MLAPQEDRPELIVVGAGAAGLWAAALAARRGARVLVLEKTPRAGTKVLASGGTRCNLTTSLDAEQAAALFGHRGARFLRRAFRSLPPEAVRGRFEALGVRTQVEALDKVFPTSGRALDVRDALLGDALAAGAQLRYSAAVTGASPEAGGWCVHLEGGQSLRSARLLLASGGASYPRTGCTGDGYSWLADLGLPLVEQVPALVPLLSPAPWVHELTGISLQAVEARLIDSGGQELARRRRPLLFTHRGVSGPAAMDVSEHVAREAAQASAAGQPAARHELRVDLTPESSWEELRSELIDAASRVGSIGLERQLSGLVPRRLAGVVLEEAGIPAGTRMNALERSGRHRLIEALKGLRVPIEGTEGFDRAEVTAGGLALSALDPGSMAVRDRPGLFVCGELLDLAGPIGGLNFQLAFSTAELASLAASE